MVLILGKVTNKRILWCLVLSSIFHPLLWTSWKFKVFTVIIGVRVNSSFWALFGISCGNVLATEELSKAVLKLSSYKSWTWFLQKLSFFPYKSLGAWIQRHLNLTWNSLSFISWISTSEFLFPSSTRKRYFWILFVAYILLMEADASTILQWK